MFPSIMWLTPLGLLAPLIWIAHKVVSFLALITPVGQDGQLIALASFIRFVLYPLWGIIW